MAAAISASGGAGALTSGAAGALRAKAYSLAWAKACGLACDRGAEMKTARYMARCSAPL